MGKSKILTMRKLSHIKNLEGRNKAGSLREVRHQNRDLSKQISDLLLSARQNHDVKSEAHGSTEKRL